MGGLTRLGTTPKAIAEAAALLRAGGVLAIPTDTVYGLACDASRADAVRRISRLKGRSEATPMAVLVSDAEMASALMSTAPAAFGPLARRWWPGPLTLIVPRSDAVSDTVAGGGPGVGLRVPDCAATVALIRALGGPIAATSANDTGEDPMTDADAIGAHFGDALDAVLDDGPSPLGVASTVVSLIGPEVVVLREGGVSRAAIAALLA